MIVITQPTYLPWSGYFDLIDRSNTFVFLDDVQFNVRSWQQRNRIILEGNYKMLTLPVKKKGLRFEKLNEVKFLDHKFIQIHLKTIYHSYSKSKYFKEYFPTIEKIYNETKSKKLLVDVNINLIKVICELIGIKSQFILSSKLDLKFSKSEKLAKICVNLKKKDYLTNIGSLEYLNNPSEKNCFFSKKIKVHIQNYECKKYSQISKIFLNQASIIDLLFNEGENSLNIIRASRKKDTILLD